ncbi:MAG: hypothetical protein VX343_04120 [Thermodesulfobacteriota bacterium]|nr:hypothetical protein [Thermodesulfobacteriota bacterium]
MKESKTKVDNSFGPSSFERDEHGLLKNVQYDFNEDGSINWRAMVKEEHLFPNKAWFERFNKPLPKTISGLKDHQLLIKLSGIKELARLRGFNSVYYDMVKCENNHVAVKCSINFIKNYETKEEVSYEDMANATTSNCSSFAVKFLETIACNRAFVRAVRNFLNVHIVGLDEMDTSDKPQEEQSSVSASFSIHSTLEKSAKEYVNCLNFDCFKEYLLELKDSNTYINSEVQSWNDYKDIPSKECRILLKLIRDQFS